uniref:non-specific serine/threonine protein kinase n=1 Tax=Leptobrachium leishanense TaxID=445787 RepID=A0A8C5R3U5_9ANUR
MCHTKDGRRVPTLTCPGMRVARGCRKRGSDSPPLVVIHYPVSSHVTLAGSAPLCLEASLTLLIQRPLSLAMSGGSVEEIFLYNVPAFTMCRFYDIMDSLDDSVWRRFASIILPDQTELRLIEQQTSRSRTEGVIWYWSNKNARVGQLLSVLRSLELLRALDVFDIWWSECMTRLSAPRNPPRRPPSPPPPYSNPRTEPRRPSEEQKEEIQSQTPTKSVSSEVPLPLPGPPPAHLLISSTCPTQASSRASSSDGLASSIHSSIQESVGPSGIPEIPKQLVWDFNELVRGTKDFSPSLLIGEGGFGCVYKATLRNTEYAVKRLKRDSELEWDTVKKSFLTEIEKLICLRHPNIVDLAGCCVQGEDYCLIYLYLPNGSLEDALHSQGSSRALSWQQRVNILLGAACGIQFLHTYQPSIIHGDVKSSNILLDQALNPKLGDFGLARFSRFANDAGKSRTLARTSTVRGTLAYLPDEYVKMGKLTYELDTYSFGVVLLEILTGKMAISGEGGSRTKYLKDLVKEEENDVPEKADKLNYVAARISQCHLDFRVWHGPADIAKDLCLMACHCLERQKKRPKMVEVFNTLKKLHELLRSFDPGKERDFAPLRGSFADVVGRIPPIPNLVSSFQALVLGPEENTTEERLPASKDSVRPFSNLSLQGGAKLDSCSTVSSCKSLRTFQRGPNTPVESDESFPDSYLSSSARGLSNLNVLHASKQQLGSASSAASSHQTPCREGASHLPPVDTKASRCGYSSDRTAGSGSSAESQAILMPHHQIIMNPAKQRIVEQLALYDQGKINSLELLSSGIDPVSLAEGRGDPEESDDLPS